MKRKRHPPGIPGCPKTRTEAGKGWIAGIVIIVVIALLSGEGGYSRRDPEAVQAEGTGILELENLPIYDYR